MLASFVIINRGIQIKFVCGVIRHMTGTQGELPLDVKYFNNIDGIFGSPNLPDTLELLSRWGFFVDPVLSVPPPVPVRSYHLNDLEANLGPWTIAYFAMVALQLSNKHRRGNLRADKFIQAINYYNAADDPITDDEDQTLRALLIRLYFQQLPYQREWWAGITRAQYMYDSSRGSDEQILAQTVTSVYGMTYNELLSLCLSIYFVIYHEAKKGRECSFTLDKMTKLLSWGNVDKLTNVIGSISQTQDEFRVACQSTQLPDRSLRKYNFNPLLSRPLIRIDDRYYAPLPMLIPIWATDGINYALLSYATIKGYDGEFLRARGYAFENFVAYLLQQQGKHFVRDEPFKIKGQEVRPADFVVVEDKAALIFDCKCRHILLKHRAGLPDAVRRDYDDIVKALCQDLQTKEWIGQGVGCFGTNPLLSGLERFFPAVVTMDEYFLANSSIIQKQVKNDLGHDITYQVLSARELELLLCNLPKNSLINTIEQKAAKSVLTPSTYCGYLRYLQDQKHISHVLDPPKQVVLDELSLLMSRIVES